MALSFDVVCLCCRVVALCVVMRCSYVPVLLLCYCIVVWCVGLSMCCSGVAVVF